VNTPPARERVLLVDCIGKSFGDRRVLASATVWAEAGRITALLGRNGCGKSTLLRIAAGQLRADFGSVRFAGETSLRPRLHRLARRGLFHLPERGLLAWTRTVEEHLDLVTARFGHDAAPVIELLQLGPLLDALPATLSTGERRRADIALALVRQPVCLLADEPLQGIAPRDVELICTALRALARLGTGVLVTGHEVRALLDLADEVIWMTAGTTHALGSPADAVAHDQFRREYLGPDRVSAARR
jgi:ABC-type multidrug transport system ATPase subunit